MISENLLVAGLLGLAFLFSNLFWAIMVSKLINKLMSRNYGEYLQAENAKKPLPPPQLVVDPVVEMLEKQKADDLNKMMGMV